MKREAVLELCKNGQWLLERLREIKFDGAYADDQQVVVDYVLDRAIEDLQRGVDAGLWIRAK